MKLTLLVLKKKPKMLMLFVSDIMMRDSNAISYVFMTVG